MRAVILALSFTVLAGSSASAQDVAAGGAVFKKCAVCHNIGPGATNKIGPELNGVVGRPAGTIASFNYSSSMKGSGLTWDEATLTTYLHAPRKLVPGTKMTFPGLGSDADIANVVAYLAQFDSNGVERVGQ